MIRQVLWITMLIKLIGGGNFIIEKTWIDYLPYQRYVIGSSSWADFKLAFTGDKDRANQIYKSENAQSHSVRSPDIKHNKIIQLWSNNFETMAIKNFWMSLFIMGEFFFVICGVRSFS